MPTQNETIELLKQAILGNRQGLDTPIYVHSVRVGDMLKRHGFSEDVQYAGLLHDIVEDGDYTFDQLRELGYNEYMIELIDLSTYDISHGDRKKAWEDMIDRLIKADNKDAWAVKFADMADNLTECHHCTPDQFKGYLFVKAPLFIHYGNKYFGGTEFYTEFINTYREQVKRFHQYFSSAQ